MKIGGKAGDTLDGFNLFIAFFELQNLFQVEFVFGRVVVIRVYTEERGLITSSWSAILMDFRHFGNPSRPQTSALLALLLINEPDFELSNQSLLATANSSASQPEAMDLLRTRIMA